MSDPLNILVIEDRNPDFLMLERHLKKSGLSAICCRVDSLEGLKEAIARERWDLVLSDYNVPQLNFQDSLILLLTKLPDVPVIMVTGTLGEERAVDLLKLGVRDFVLKDNLTRLVPAIRRSLKEEEDLAERRRAEGRLRESEAKSRSIIDNIGIGVALISPKMEVLELNHRMRDWFPAVDPGKHPLCHLVFNDPPRDSVCEYCPTRKTLQDGLVHEYTTQRPETGGARNFRIVSSPIFNEAGEVTAAIEMVEDITEKLSLESQLRQSQKIEAIGQLAGGVAHDFNNILSAIFGYSHLILDRSKGDEAVENYVEEIMKASKRAAVLTQGLLAFSRKQPVTLGVIDLGEVIQGNEAFLRRLIREDVELTISPAIEPLSVLADRGQIEQVVMNLVTNARDAMPDGGKLRIEMQSVRLSAEFVEAHGYGTVGEFVLFTVSDNGAGIDKATQSRIFEPFFTTKEPGKGTGLGLSMVYGIVKKHDGFVNVYSEPGSGTVFRIYLPRVDARAQAGNIGKTEAGVLRGGTETILVGEDDAALRRLSTKVLGHYGYRVIEAVDGQDAIDRFIEFKDCIDLVILDLVMPKKNGKAAFDELKKLRPDLKTIFTSGYARGVIKDDFVLDRHTGFIQKPISPVELAAKVREMLDRKTGGRI